VTRRISVLDRLLKYWPLVVGLAGIVTVGMGAVRDHQKHLDEYDKLLERVRVLENIAVSEHPAYSASIFTR
jgi:hypothetical protein